MGNSCKSNENEDRNAEKVEPMRLAPVPLSSGVPSRRAQLFKQSFGHGSPPDTYADVQQVALPKPSTLQEVEGALRRLDGALWFAKRGGGEYDNAPIVVTLIATLQNACDNICIGDLDSVLEGEAQMLHELEVDSIFGKCCYTSLCRCCR